MIPPSGESARERVSRDTILFGRCSLMSYACLCIYVCVCVLCVCVCMWEPACRGVAPESERGRRHVGLDAGETPYATLSLCQGAGGRSPVACCHGHVACIVL